MRNLIIIGMRGAGKSFIAEKLACELNLKLVSTDKLIEENYGQISNLVKEGWSRFRDIETKILIKNLPSRDCIIDCGGGILDRAENIKLLPMLGTIIWIKTSAELIKQRISNGFRPRLTDLDSIDEIDFLIEKRNKKFRNIYEIMIDGDKKIEEILEEIIEKAQLKIYVSNRR